MSHDTLKVCIFTGFLGAGKTTILQRILHSLPSAEGVRIIVNDISRDNIDVHAFQSPDAAQLESSNGSGGVTALSGGCVCCSLLGVLVAELQSAHTQGCRYVFLECTGVADTVPIVATLYGLPELNTRIEIDAVVNVVAAASLLAVTTGDQVMLESMDVFHGDQIKGANVVLINNWEYAERIDAAMMRLWVQHIKKFASESNPHVRVYCTNAGFMAFESLVYCQGLFVADNVGSFFLRSYIAAGKAIGDFGGDAAAKEEADEMKKLGMQLFTLELPGAFLSMRLLRQALAGSAGRQLLKGVWRSKGYLNALDDEGGDGACSANGVQFRWQTVGRKVDYGEVLRPYVPLTRSEANEPLCCRVVFIGYFDANDKATQAAAFFSSAASGGV